MVQQSICEYCENSLSGWDYMTSCGHIICSSNCFNRYEHVCPICKKQCEFMLIGEDEKQGTTGFLTSTRNLFDDIENIIQFRTTALVKTVISLRSKVSRQKNLLKQVKTELNQVNEYKQQIFELQQENENLKRQLIAASSNIILSNEFAY
ncbi:MAG: hypothetical protein EXX96DRAFT_569606 [Benjaminiella poitrasii]|nr:MAG: hypothetical protein EXX96DRAFT_569606 [Benjaminiella poitrasii]